MAYIIKAYLKEKKESKQYIPIRRFYRSDKRKVVRVIKIVSCGRLCEKCGAIGTSVHHKIHLNPDNVNYPEVSLNQDYLRLLCNGCHNKKHGSFK